MLLIEGIADVNVRRDVIKLVNQILFHTRGKDFPDAESGVTEVEGYAPGTGEKIRAKMDYVAVTLGGDLQLPGLKVEYSELRVGVIYVDGNVMLTPHVGKLISVGPHDLPTVLVAFQQIPKGLSYGRKELEKLIVRYKDINPTGSWRSIDDVDIGAVLREMSDVLVHELTHAVDYLSKHRRGWGLKTRSFKPARVGGPLRPTKFKPEEARAREAYLKNEAEINAFLFEFFYNLTRDLKKRFRKLSRKNALAFAPRFQDLWELFLEKIPESHLDFLDEKFLMKKYAKRLLYMWQAYVSKLPDE